MDWYRVPLFPNQTCSGHKALLQCAKINLVDFEGGHRLYPSRVNFPDQTFHCISKNSCSIEPEFKKKIYLANFLAK